MSDTPMPDLPGITKNPAASTPATGGSTDVTITNTTPVTQARASAVNTSRLSLFDGSKKQAARAPRQTTEQVMAWAEARQKAFQAELDERLRSCLQTEALDTTRQLNMDVDGEETDWEDYEEEDQDVNPRHRAKGKQIESTSRSKRDFKEAFKPPSVEVSPRDFSKTFRPTVANASTSKFAKDIAEAIAPKSAKQMSNIGTYDGISDPDDHLNRFIAGATVSNWTEPTWCYMFQMTLVGAARAWFDRLPVHHIYDWADFHKKFSQHFSQQRKYTEEQWTILNCMRDDDESLLDYITRFNAKKLSLGPISEDLVLAAFIQGVESPELIRTLSGKDGIPRTWDAIMTASRRFAETEKQVGRNLPQNTHIYSQRTRENNTRTARQNKRRRGGI